MGSQRAQMCWLEGNVLASERNDLIIKQSFQIIGDVIENACKPFVFFLNELRCMVTGKESKQQKLGKAVDALMNFHDIFKGLYKGLLLDISLSQWRNIADHGSYESIENGVRITYGANGEYEKNITKQELILLLHTIDALYYMHKTAHTLATVEYPESISVTTSYTKSKEETWNDNVIAQMVETSYSYGLELSEIDKEEGRWNVLLDRKKEIDKNELVQYLSVIVSILEEYEITIKRADKVEYKAWCINGKLSIYKFEV